MEKPLISIITVVFNANFTLENTIQSILSQDKALFEYWIVDGGSTDGSVEIIRKYESHLAGWVSESDKGIYDAMNKGIEQAKGEWLYFIGGDDILRPNVLKEVQSYLTKPYLMVFGDVKFDNGHKMRSFLGTRTIFQNTVHHQATFYNRSLFEQYRYDPTLTIVSEYDIHLRLYVNKVPTFYIPVVIAECATGGASSDLWRSLKETNRVRAKYVLSKRKNKVLSLLLGVYYFQKKIRFILYGHRV